MQRIEATTSTSTRIAIFFVAAVLLCSLGLYLSLHGTPVRDITAAPAAQSLLSPVLTSLIRVVAWTGEPAATASTAVLVVWLWTGSQCEKSVLFGLCVTGVHAWYLRRQPGVGSRNA